MKFLTPTHTPPLSMLLQDVGNPSNREIARYLDVSERTVYRWRADDCAPQPVLLSIFWLSSYGADQLRCDALAGLQYQQSLTNSLRHENQNLRVRVSWLEKNGRFDCANQPFLHPVLPSDTRVSAVS